MGLGSASSSLCGTADLSFAVTCSHPLLRSFICWFTSRLSTHTGGSGRAGGRSEPIRGCQEKDQLRSAGEGRAQVQHRPGLQGNSQKHTKGKAVLSLRANTVISILTYFPFIIFYLVFYFPADVFSRLIGGSAHQIKRQSLCRV